MDQDWALETASQLHADALSLLESTDTSLIGPELELGGTEEAVLEEEQQLELELEQQGQEQQQEQGEEEQGEEKGEGDADGDIALLEGAPTLSPVVPALEEVVVTPPQRPAPARAANSAPAIAGSGSVAGKLSNGGVRRSVTATTASTVSPRPFLRSSSSAAAARRLSIGNGNGNGPQHPSSNGSNGSNGSHGSPAAGGPTMKRSPSLNLDVRRSSASPRTLALSSPKPLATPPGSRRASLSAVSSTNSPVSPSDLKKWASSSSSSASKGLGSNLSPAGSKLPSPRASTAKTPAQTAKLGAVPSSTSSPRLHAASSSPSVPNAAKSSTSLPSTPAANGTRKQPTPVVVKRSPKTASPSATSLAKHTSPSSADKSKVPSAAKVASPSPLSADRGPSMLSRRKSLTSETRDPRFINLPSVDVKAGDDVRLDLRGQKVRSLDGNLVNLTPKMEFVYLRDNKLTTLNGIETLRRVKVLDLSFNEFKGSGFEPLAGCKSLQQLYLAGNQITSLTGLPSLPNLEFLSVAQNKIKSLAMATQPRLQVLAASKNKISTLKGFPHLPALEHLRLEENPILDVPHVEAASILLLGPTLKKFNDRDLSLSEVELAQMYPAHTAFSIREGWNLCSPEEAAESILRFLTEQWEGTLPHGYVLKKVSVDRPMEEDPCRCDFLFEKEDGTDDDSDLDLRYQWFVGEKSLTDFVAIEGATVKEYWPKHEDVGNYLKIECTPIVAGVECSPIHLISLPVATGSGIPKVLRLDVEGELMEGCTLRGSAYVAWRGGTPSKGVVSWLRFTENGSPVAILGAEEYEYKLTVDDIGANLVFMYTPVTEEGAKGDSQHATTNLIQAAPPSVGNVHIVGDAVEGNTIEGVGKYFGGREGPSKFEWLREDRDSGEFKLVSRGTCEYFLTEDDVGLRIMFIYTPVNNQAVHGNPASIISAKVLRAPPKVTNLRIIGDIKEGSKLALSATFVGGVEGPSRVQWFKSPSPVLKNPVDLDAISTTKVAKTFRVPLPAIGYYLVAKYTPVRSDGEIGEPVFAVSESQVEMLSPALTSLTINGELLEGETLTASYGYIGGHEGQSQYNWYLHEFENDLGYLVPEAAGKLQYQVSLQAVGKFVSFRCVPVRDDGVLGEGRTTFCPEPVRAGSPKLVSLQISGEAVEGAELTVKKLYWGGEEGPSRLQWFLTRPDGAQREIKGAVGVSYVVRSEDIDGFVCVSCDPARSDGVRGATAVSQLVGPVSPSAPACESLEIIGGLVEGGTLQLKALYTGGVRGACRQEWHRRDFYGRDVLLSLNDTLHLTGEDVGARIRLVFIPVRQDGIVGEPVEVLSDVVVDADPEGKELEIPHCSEDVPVTPRKVYFGGQEGPGEYAWYRTAEDAVFQELPHDAKLLSHSLSYTPRLEDVGHHLVLHWVPSRKDGKRGKPVLACSKFPVEAAPPSVHSVHLAEVSPGLYQGEGIYYGGVEGSSQRSWYRLTPDGSKLLIEGAVSSTYTPHDDDYTCRLIFGYLPVRADGIVGELALTEPSSVVYPEMPRVHRLVFTGKAVEGEVLTALEVIPKGETQEIVWEKYKKEIKYQWSRSRAGEDVFEPIPLQRVCSFKVRLEDVGYCLQCECTLVDVFGRTGEPVSEISAPVQPGFPKIDKLEVDGLGYHTSLYAVRGLYFGGKEGKSTVQWFRAMAGSPDLIPISGEVGRMYEANVDDVGYRLVAVYTPVREDGVEGMPTSASTDPVTVEPEIAKEVKQKVDLGVVKFEALRDRDRSPMKGQQILGSLERRVLDVNRKRVKVVKPLKASFASTELRGTYAPPFHVELFRNDQHRLKIVIDLENEVELMVQSRHIRDVIVLVLRGLAQRYNSTPLNLLLKM